MSEDSRLVALRHWLQAGCPDAEIELRPASADASFRRYFRVSGLGPQTLIAMDAPPEQERLGPFIDVAGRLAAAGLRVPEVLRQDLRQGFLLLTDLGRQTFLEAFAHEDPAAMVESALPVLVRMQAATDPSGLPVYDQALLQRELSLFPDWYLARERGLSLSAREEKALADWFDRLCERGLAQPRVFVHRDFMPRNLMVGGAEPGMEPGVIDFQDAVLGPVSYDPVCLYMDAFHSFPESTVTAGLGRYHELARAAGIPVPEALDEFLRDACWMGVQRHLKVIGIFARIAHRDGKPHYLSDVPRFFDYLERAALFDRELRPLVELISPWRPPASAEAAG
ncbi:phosphotransferase [Gammaproteobacteria bacterium AB-CW1]|uniref:Phosphotransferase n=1 Tax=Natronospira elongata TaxID=3110268 RepID=A0AAP6JI56_9GAMM|nr:phosphotransferase [Gammaproteobacteria bacterium AB-CW1]